MSNVNALSENTWDGFVGQSAVPVLVDFWAPWCGPCQTLGPIVDTLATENDGKIAVGKVNVDENKGLAVKYGVRGIPTLLFFKGGAEVKRIVGVQNKAQLQQVIDELTAP
ncbi:MAG: thioredoxin [Syntrophomonadaceae bacterium]|nr:thioredoxin [Syntrophomonadaceae bacterium]